MKDKDREEFWISEVEGEEVEYHKKKYILYDEIRCAITRYTIGDDDNDPYYIEIHLECDAKEVGADNYVTIFWEAKSKEPDKWIHNKIQNKKWDDDITGIIPIDPPED